MLMNIIKRWQAFCDQSADIQPQYYNHDSRALNFCISRCNVFSLYAITIDNCSQTRIGRIFQSGECPTGMETIA